MRPGSAASVTARCRSVPGLSTPEPRSLPLLPWQLPEYGCQAALTVLLLLTGRWFYGGMHLVVLAYHARQVRAPCSCSACTSEGFPCSPAVSATLAAEGGLQPHSARTPPSDAPPHACRLHPLQFVRRQHLADVTEIFRQVAPRKQREMVKLVRRLWPCIVLSSAAA